jgi:anti-sigma B factor antagonist
MDADHDEREGGQLLRLPRRSDVLRRHIGDAVVLDVSGDLDLKHAARLGAEIGEVLRARPRRLVLELCQTGFVDSSGLSVLLAAKRRTAELGVDLKVACDVPGTLRVLALTALDRSLDVHSTLQSALGDAEVDPDDAPPSPRAA